MVFSNRPVLLLQKGNVNVSQYGARAVLMKVKYIEALLLFYKAAGKKLPISRMQEAEALVTKHFILGLKRETKINVRSEPKTLTGAIGFAEEILLNGAVQRIRKIIVEIFVAQHEVVEARGGKGAMARVSVTIVLPLGPNRRTKIEVV